MTTTTEPTAQQVLALPMKPGNDADAATVRDYLIKLLANVWQDGECFNGKRPFGNSGWECDLYEPLAKAGYIDATFDEDGYLDVCDDKAGDALIATAITELTAPSTPLPAGLQPEFTTVYVSIGNSDDELSQVEWCAYVQDFVECMDEYAEKKFGEWYPAPVSAWQNACIAAFVPTSLLGELRAALTAVRKEYRQDSIAWAEVPKTEFI